MSKFKNAKEVIEQVSKRQKENETNTVPNCPRCGLERMSSILYMNALSRYEKVYICDDCGIDEAMAGYLGEEHNLDNWFIVKECKEEGILD